MESGDTRRFLELLVGRHPDEHYFLVWSLPSKRSLWFRTTATGIESAAVEAARLDGSGADVYVGAATSDRQHGTRKRISAAETAGIGALWADVDYADPTHKKQNLPATRDDAAKLLRDALPEPSILVASGHGLQAWWLLDEPWIFHDLDSQALAAETTYRWNHHLREVAASHGYDVDSTHDLARVMRLPGTHNHKGEESVPVEIVEAALHEYEPSFVREMVGTPPEPTRPTVRSFSDAHHDFTLRRDAAPPTRKWDALRRLDRNVELTFNRRRRDLGDQSPSGYDMALANYAAAAGWDDQEIVDLLVYARVENGEEAKLDRPDYYARTVRKSRDSVAASRAGEAIEEVLDEMKDAPAGEAPPEDPTTDFRTELLDWLAPILNIGVLRVERLRTDPPTYRLHTENGWVTLGTSADLLNQRHVKSRMLDVTRTSFAGRKQAQWDRVAEAIVQASVDVDLGPEPTTVGSTAGWLAEYLNTHEPAEELDESVAIAKVPFVRDGHVHLFMQHFRNWLYRVDGERLSTRELSYRLRLVGAEAVKVNVTVEGRSTSRSTWRLPDNVR